MNGNLSRIVRIGAAVLVTAAFAVGLFTSTAASAEARGGGAGQGGRGGQMLGPLSPAEVKALTDAIHEEYLAMNTYQAVIAQYGSIVPFTRIAASEARHVEALARLFTKYDVPVPENPGLAPAPTWASVKAACQSGVDAEIADAALYDALSPQVSHGDILRVFSNLQKASLDNHLPAFEDCN